MDFEVFLAMGGYAKYVWPAYSLVTCVMAGVLFFSLRGLKTSTATLARLKSEETPSEDIREA